MDALTQVQTEVSQAVDALQKLSAEAASAERQTVRQIEELFGAPTDTRGQFEALRRVVLNLAGRVAELEAANVADQTPIKPS